MKNKGILVTGINGLLGTTLLGVLKKRGYTVHGMDVDIGDKRAVEQYTKKCRDFDLVVHTAAMTNVGRCEKEHKMCMRSNAEGTKNMRDLAQAIGAHFICISTVSVFSAGS